MKKNIGAILFILCFCLIGLTACTTTNTLHLTASTDETFSVAYGSDDGTSLRAASTTDSFIVTGPDGTILLDGVFVNVGTAETYKSEAKQITNNQTDDVEAAILEDTDDRFVWKAYGYELHYYERIIKMTDRTYLIVNSYTDDETKGDVLFSRLVVEEETKK